MSALILCGVLWRVFEPAALGADQTRLVVTQVVYHLLLPALMLSVLWQARLGVESLLIALLAVASFIAVGSLGWIVFKCLQLPRPQTGSLLLATAFPNVTYLGLPLLETVFGAPGRAVAVQFDLFAFTPLFLTAGVIIARHYGTSGEKTSVSDLLLPLLRVPPLWAGALAVAFNLWGLPLPEWLGQFSGRLAEAVAPLMLFSLGLGLRWGALCGRNLAISLPVIFIKLLMMPLLALGLALWLTLQGVTLIASVLELAMPSMVAGIVLCDRYGLDSSLYSLTVTLATVSSFVTLPLWQAWLSEIAEKQAVLSLLTS